MHLVTSFCSDFGDQVSSPSFCCRLNVATSCVSSTKSGDYWVEISCLDFPFFPYHLRFYWFLLLASCSSFTMLQHLAIWGNLAAFYVINWIFSAIPSSGMYTIMFRLCGQPSYWITIFVSLPWPTLSLTQLQFFFSFSMNFLGLFRQGVSRLEKLFNRLSSFKFCVF